MKSSNTPLCLVMRISPNESYNVFLISKGLDVFQCYRFDRDIPFDRLYFVPDHHASITEPHARGLAGHLFLLHLRISGASAGATNNLFDSKFEQVLFLRDQESFISELFLLYSCWSSAISSFPTSSSGFI